MDRAEKAGLGVALAGHIVLFGLLSVGFLATPNPMKLQSDPVEVQFVDEIGLKSAFPEPAKEAPAESVAPEIGIAQDSPPPAPELAPPAPIEPVPAPPPAPAPKLVPKAPPQPRRAPAPPAPAKAKPAPARPSAKAAPSRTDSKAAGSAEAAKPQPRRGSRLGDDFRKGLTAQTSQAKGQTPRAAVVGAQALSSLGAAIARQIRPCYDLGPLGGTAAMDIVVKVRLQPDRAGVVSRSTMEIVGFSGVNGSNSAYQGRMAEVARNAVLNPRCSPLSLPAELYEGGWQDITLNFIPRQLG